MVKFSSRARCGLAIIGACVALLITVNVVLGAMNTTISQYLGTSSNLGDAEYTTEELYEQGVDLSTQIEEEGAVLLKNENNVLPLGKNAKVSLMGTMSINYVLGGTGSGGGVDDDDTVMMKDAFEKAGLDVNDDLYEWLAEACGNSSATGLTHKAASGNIGVDSSAGASNGSAAWNSADTAELELKSDTYTTWTDNAGKTAKEEIGDYTTAIVTFARTGAEGASLTVDKDGDGSGMTGTTYLELTDNERDLLSFCKTNFNHTVVLINSATPMELGFLDNEDYGIEACLWIGHPGEAGLYGVGNILVGTTSPSGSLADTYAYDMSTEPGYYGNGDTRYTNLEGNNSIWGETSGQFFKTNGLYLYSEGIYVGYRWYETADAEGYFDTQDFKKINFKNDSSDSQRTAAQLKDGGSARATDGGYENVVQFPFGYSGSYTTFDQTIKSSDIDLKAHGTNTITVTVKNTGDTYTSSTSVQIYMEAPYNQDSSLGIKGQGLEKAAKVLVGFAKTGDIEPGGEEDVTITFETDDLASYDYTGRGCYVLEQGDYTFYVGKNAHDSYTKTDDIKLNNTIVYNDDGVGKRDSDETVATNQLDDVSAGDGNLTCDTYLSRSNFASGITTLMQYKPGEGTGLNLELGDAQKAAVLTTGTNSTSYTYTYYKNGEKTTATETLYNQASTASFNAEKTPDGLDMNDESYRVTFGSTATDYKIADMYDEDGNLIYELSDYNDDMWDVLLDEVTLDECIENQGHSGWTRPAIESLGIESFQCIDGPLESGNGDSEHHTWWPSEIVMAATFDTDLATQMGLTYGYQSADAGYAGAYAPAMDTHRSPFGGRNFEYFSEDGFIAGKMGAQVVTGIQSTGTMVYIKHFMLNDNDDNRNGAFTWCNEQAVREVYGRPFEISVKEGNALGLMASLNRIGMSSEHYGLYVNILRNEWGFKGHLITDGLGPLADAGQGLFNTPSICTASFAGILDQGNTRVDSAQYVAVDGDAAYTTLYGQYCLRQITKNVLYQYVVSGDINRTVDLNHVWWAAWVIVDVILAAGLVLAYIFMVNKDVIALFTGKGTTGDDTPDGDENGTAGEAGNANE